MHFDRAGWADMMRSDYPRIADELIAKADRVAGGDLSHGTIAFPVDGKEIDWFHNPKKDTNYVSIAGSQWFLTPMGRAYLLTGDEKYAEAFAWIHKSWYDNVPAMEEWKGGINIRPVFHAYYPGIRTRILIDNYYCMAKSPALTPEIHVRLMKAILAGSEWLYANNAGYKVGNQQVAATMGMIVAGIVMPEFKNAEAWVERGLQWHRQHLVDDFFPDGAHRELCTQYHKTCLRDMSLVALTARMNGLPSFFDEGDESREAFERAYEWLARVVMPSGLTPPIHSAVFSNDYAVHLEIAGREFDRPDFAYLAGRVWETGLVPNQKGPSSLANYILASPADGAEAEPPGWLSELLPDSGFAIHRTGWDAGDRYLIMQYGWPNSGHAYPAALHFLLEQGGDVVATAPGSPRSYRLPSYQYCHSTRSHNLVTIDGVNYAHEGRFAAGGQVEKYADIDGAWYVRASHKSLSPTLDAGHQRQILAIDDGPVVIRDVITGGAGHKAQWNFHTPLRIARVKDGALTLRGNKGHTLCMADAEELGDPRIESHWSAVPPALCQPDDCGMEVPAIIFEREIEGDGCEFIAAIIEGDGSIERTDGGVRVTAGEDAYNITFGDAGACSVVVNGEETLVVE